MDTSHSDLVDKVLDSASMALSLYEELASMDELVSLGFDVEDASADQKKDQQELDFLSTEAIAHRNQHCEQLSTIQDNPAVDLADEGYESDEDMWLNEAVWYDAEEGLDRESSRSDASSSSTETGTSYSSSLPSILKPKRHVSFSPQVELYAGVLGSVRLIAIKPLSVPRPIPPPTPFPILSLTPPSPRPVSTKHRVLYCRATDIWINENLARKGKAVAQLSIPQPITPPIPALILTPPSPKPVSTEHLVLDESEIDTSRLYVRESDRRIKGDLARKKRAVDDRYAIAKRRQTRMRDALTPRVGSCRALLTAMDKMERWAAWAWTGDEKDLGI